MKALLIGFMVILSLKAFATPVMDTAVGTPTELLSTVVPDSKDPNLFYFFPSHFGLANDPKTHRQLFSYIEKSGGFLGLATNGFVNTIFAADVSPVLDQKIAEIRKANGNAKFSPIPISDATFVGHDVFNVLISDIQCQQYGNTIGQQIACVWKVEGSRNCENFRTVIQHNALVQILDYQYSFTGMIQGKPRTFTHSIPVYVSDLGTGDYFFDSNGREL